MTSQLKSPRQTSRSNKHAQTQKTQQHKKPATMRAIKQTYNKAISRQRLIDSMHTWVYQESMDVLKRSHARVLKDLVREDSSFPLLRTNPCKTHTHTNKAQCLPYIALDVSEAALSSQSFPAAS